MKRIFYLLVILAALAWLVSVAVNPSPTGGSYVRESAPEKVEEERELTPEEKKAQQLQFHGNRAIVSAQRQVRRELRDPGSAEFKDVYANYTEEFGVVACGQVNSKNALGGYTGFKRFVTSSGGSVIMEGRDNIGEAWAGACL